jgi:hypothetical protein
MRLAPLLLLTAACVSTPDETPTDPSIHGMHSDALARTKGQSPNLVDHGGTILPVSSSVAIYWGTPGDFPSDLQAGMASLLGGLNGSSYLGIMNQYMRGATATTSYAGAVSDTSAPPKSAPSTSALAAEVCKLFPNPDPDALYIVFTSNAPKVNYCAWHNKATCNGVAIQVAYVPNQALMPGCSPTTVTNLNCNSYSAGTVTTADSVAHELLETITDAQIDAWYDSSHAEVADKCEYTYGACVQLPNHSLWQIQQEWSNALGGCQQQ